MGPGIKKKWLQGASLKCNAHPAGCSDLSRVPQASESRVAYKTRLGGSQSNGQGQTGRKNRLCSQECLSSLGAQLSSLGHIKLPTQLRICCSI